MGQERLYSLVLAFLAAARRTHEIGVRIALGAERRSVVAVVLRRSVGVALIGTAVGLVGAGVGSRALRSLLYDVPTLDPLALGSAVVLLVAAASLAACLPARRAARIDPMEALRQE